jgi:hypothetical protein
MVPQPCLCLQEDFLKQVMVQLARSVFNDKLSKKGSKMFLESAQTHVNLLANIWNSQYGINIQDVNRLGLGQKSVPKPNPMFFLGWVKLQHLLPKPKPVLESFVWVWVGLGWAGLNKPGNFSPS